MVQVKAVDAVKNETENKWVRGLLVYGFEKLSIDDIPFNDPNIDIRDIVKIKVVDFIKEMAEPSKGLFWYLVLYHWIVLGIIIFTR
ncbi:hypothetical protein GJV76_02155 [Myroides sp. BIT-d1]|uniref:Uncharacterized protein n=1 Tax=Myroides albus TaxID=2562892 RepID=A0A6I3LHA7_9FLAO|nr:hypothetical protein [Myroides albus]MVX35351.1 hypothetical protein [Myroides sp. LoEW2-1]